VWGDEQADRRNEGRRKKEKEKEKEKESQPNAAAATPPAGFGHSPMFLSSTIASQRTVSSAAPCV
jgi:hypothetical protein